MTSEETLNLVMAAMTEVFEQQVTEDQNFFELNGSSLQAVSAVLRIEESLGREIEFSMLLEAKSFVEFSALIEE